MRLSEIQSLQDGDTVVVYGKKEKVKELPSNGTIRLGDRSWYYSELQTLENYKYNKKKNGSNKEYNFLNKLV